MARKCKQCTKEFENKRSDAKFCSNTCKARYWEAHKNSCKEKENSLKSTLKGVVNEKEETIGETKEEIKKVEPPLKTYEYVKVENPKYITMLDNIGKLKLQKVKTERKIISLKEDNKFLSKKENINPEITCAGLGAILVDPSFSSPINFILGAGIGWLFGIAIGDKVVKSNEENSEIGIMRNTAEIKSLDGFMTSVSTNLTKLESQILSINKFEVKQIEAPKNKTTGIELDLPSLRVYSPEKFLNKNKEVPKIIDKNQEMMSSNDVKKYVQTSQTTEKPVFNSKIISSQELAKYDYEALDFKGRWFEFVGQPSLTFHCAIHGKAGEGKSTFAIQFANYLANSFGRVVYISGEEGFSKTIKDKFVNNNAMSQNLYVADLRNYNDIIKEIGVNDFHFIFIDSLSNMRIDGDNLKQLFERYKNSAIIVICQATKDGKMRGSYEIIHDVDIEIVVKEGLAETNKNRFKEKHKEFKVF